MYLRSAIEFLVGTLDRDPDNIPALALAEFEQLLMVSFLGANPHNHSHLLERRPPNVGGWQLRAAEDYIEANWNRPIYVEDILIRP